MITPAQKILLESAQQQIDQLKRELFIARAEIQTLKMELDQKQRELEDFNK